MVTTTVRTDSVRTDGSRVPTDRLSRAEVRAALPVVVAVLMLFGLLLWGAHALEQVVDLGLWLVSTA